MIPLKLQIKNFLSYGAETQTVDFSSYRLICLSGRNGHGKSALLDAMTWAVWGHARKIAGAIKADLGLLRLGQDHMMVIFDFVFDDEIYRIRREFSLNYGKHQATLEFGILDLDTDTVKPLTDKTIRATQRKIEKTLGLDYESFINSSFLRQGHANEFSKKSSKERKEILANILGLNKYETIRKLAMDKIKQANIQKNMLNTLQEKITQELEQKKTIQEQLATVTKELKTLADQDKKLVKKQTTITTEQTILIEQQKKRDMLLFQLEQLEQEEHKQQKQLRILVTSWRSVHAKQLDGIDHQQLEKEKATLTEHINTYQKQLQERLKLKEQYLKAKEELQKIEQEHTNTYSRSVQEKQVTLERLHADKNNKEKNGTELNKRLQQHQTETKQLIQELSTLQKQHKKNNTEQKKHTAIEEQFDKRKSYYQKFVAQGNWLNTQLHNLEQKKQLVHNDDDPSCPLCEQNLSASRKRFLKSKFAQSEKFIRHQFERVSYIITQLKTILIAQHKELEQYKQIQEAHTKREATIAELTKTQIKTADTVKEIQNTIAEQQKSIVQLTKQIDTEQTALNKLKQNNSKALEKNTTYTMLKNSLKKVEEQAKKIAYNPEKHQAVQKQLQEIEQKLVQATQLKEQQANQTQRKKEISVLCKQLKQYKKQKQECDSKLNAYKELQEQEKNLKEKIVALQQSTKKLTQKKETLLQQKGSLQTQQEKLKKIEKEHKENQKKIAEFSATITDYQAISTATGKDGIQALLIEDAIPEIEQEANKLLSKLTNNQAQIFIESLRDLKSGGTKETLDIKISDPVGIRPYELFSGGEAFRIDFALRIAISKLLARRAGTALQTLIIDEGFGSQDEEGLGHIMDAIYKIQEDFSKIIIVSHLSAMKDQFPVHFVVEKLASGSHVTVVEHG